MDDCIERFPHQRSSGKRLVYEAAIWPDYYTISLHGNILKNWKRPIVAGGDTNPLQVTRLFAIDDIEKLVGMMEE